MLPMSPSAGRLINLLARKSQGYITDLMRPFGLTAAEQPFFMALLHNEGVTQERLTSLVGVDKAATARTVKSLEEKGGSHPHPGRGGPAARICFFPQSGPKPYLRR